MLGMCYYLTVIGIYQLILIINVDQGFPTGGHGTLKGGHGYKMEFWGAVEDFRGATAQEVNF